MSAANLHAGETSGLRRRTGLTAAVVISGLLGLASIRAQAEDVVAEWNRPPATTGQLVLTGAENLSEDGQPFQRLRFHCASEFAWCRIEASLPASRPVEEFRAVTRVNSTHAGLRLALRLVLPDQTNPRTGQPLVTWVAGNSSTHANQWQELTVQLTSAAVEAQLRRLRSEFHTSEINTAGMYVEGCTLLAELSRGQFAVDLSSVAYGPVVPLDPSAQHTAGQADSKSPAARVRVERNQIVFQDRPVFLRLMPDHGESLEQLRSLGINAVWLPDYRSSDRSESLARAGMIVAATPPHPRLDPADFSEPVQGLLPLEQISPSTDLWYLGTRVAPGQLPHLLAWAREIRSADRMSRRPLMADVTAAEGRASRQVDLVGLAAPALHRDVTFGEFRNRVLLRGRTASQLTLPWAWIQAESPAAMTSWRKSLDLPPLVVEPEQITMQVVAALSGGARGIGFWKREPTTEDSSETGLAIALATLQIELLEPWLINGRVQSHIAIDDRPRRSEVDLSKQKAPWAAALSSSPLSTNPDLESVPKQPDAAMISGRESSLVLAALWDATSQFVPGPLHAAEGRLTVVASDTASASRITSTGVYGQRRTEVAGGLPLVIKDLDQYAILLISSDPAAVRDLDRRVQQMAPRAAALRCAMAERKSQRVRHTCSAIDSIHPQPPADAASTLKNAVRHLNAARASLQSEQFADADGHARNCLRSLRLAQNAYWRAAISELPSPTASPFTIAFSSLPEHWQMMQRITAGAPDSGNLLTTGGFDNVQRLDDSGWTVAPLTTDYQSRVDLRTDIQRGGRYLQLAAWRSAAGQPPSGPVPTALILAPPVQASAGDIIEVRGHVRFGSSIRAEDDYPLMIFDSELGADFAVRPFLEPSWRTFHMFRVVAADGPFQVSFSLKGGGDVHVDAVTIRKVGITGSGPAWPALNPGRQPRPLTATPGPRVPDSGYSLR